MTPAATDGPLSYNQRALWFVQRLAPRSSAYNLAVAVRTGEVAAAPLREAWHALAERHELLRATYPAAGGEPVLRIHPRLPIDFTEVDATAAGAAELDRLLAAAAGRPFDLERGPALRVLLCRRAPGDHVMMFAVHHIGFDFLSTVNLLDDLSVLYPAARRGRCPGLDPLPASYRDFVAGERELLASGRGAELESFWRLRLAAAPPPLELPWDRPRPRLQTYAGALRGLELPAGLTRGLKDLAADAAPDRGRGLAPLLLAAFQALLHRYSGQDDLVVGCPVSGRDRPELRRLVGFFVNTLAVRSRIAGDPPFSRHWAAVRRAREEAEAHREYPFPLLVERLQLARDPSVSPLFQTLFVLYQGDEERVSRLLTRPRDEPLDVGGLELESHPLPGRASMLDLSLMAGDAGDRIRGHFQYNTDLFDEPTAARVAEDFEALLEAVAADPDRRLSELPATLGRARSSAARTGGHLPPPGERGRGRAARRRALLGQEPRRDAGSLSKRRKSDP